MVAESLQSVFLLSNDLRGLLALLAEEAAPATTLPEPVRQVAYMALLGIVLLGMLMIVATLLGGHWVRRWGDRLRRPAVPPDMILPKQPPSPTPELPASDLPSDPKGDPEEGQPSRP